MSLIERLGDPSGAVSVALMHDFGSEASMELAALLRARLMPRLPEVETRVQALGFELVSLARTSEQASQFVTLALSALRQPVTPGEPALALARREPAPAAARGHGGAAESAVAGCSGELYVPAQSQAASITADATRLEGWRRALYTRHKAAFAVLGSRAVLDAGVRALDSAEPWPDQPRPEDPWPASNLTGAVAAPEAAGRLSVALRLPDGLRALETARQLTGPDSSLAARLQALSAPWKIERSVGVLRARGACVRVDLTVQESSGLKTEDAARAALLASQEVEALYRSVRLSEWQAAQELVRPPDPRDSAAIAAWRLLVGKLEPGPTRRFINWFVRPDQVGQKTDAELSAALERLAAEWSRPALERRIRVEAGQSDFWLLLASPCGTRTEQSDDSGVGALFVRSVAVKFARVSGVYIEPWVTPDGVGLLAHGPPSGPAETAFEHAERIGAALGWALVGSRLSASEVSHGRAQLLDELGPGPRPGWWLVLESLAPSHPSWLEPRGTFTSVSQALPEKVRGKQRELITGPLRVAVIANANRQQAETAVAALERWISPMRGRGQTCAEVGSPVSRNGQLTLESHDLENDGVAYVAVPVATAAYGIPIEARAAEYLLNRSGGWLEGALVAPGLASSARAFVLGGKRATALAIEVRALDQDKVRMAVEQVRGLLDRLSQGAATQADADSGLREQALREQTAAMDPRQRIVDLWRGASNPGAAPLTLKSLRSFLSALGKQGHLVVYVKNQR
jgi:hypothetical protein